MTDNSDVRVIVVEDEPSIRNSLADFLEDYDFYVFAAKSAEQALEVMTEESFHVALVDIRLPGINGDVFILKAHEIIPSMRFIIYTGSVDYALSKALQKISIKPEHIFLKPQPDLTAILVLIIELIKQMKAAGTFKTL